MLDINLLKDLGEAITAASKALDALVKTMKDLVASGVRVYDELKARRMRQDLLLLTKSLSWFAAASNVKVVRSIDEYLTKSNPTYGDWQAITLELTGALSRLRKLIERAQAEGSGFVATTAYRDILDSLAQREIILKELIESPQPTDKAAVRELTVVNRRYKRLMKDLRSAIDQLNIYLGEEFLVGQPTEHVAIFSGIGAGWPRTDCN